MSKKQYITDKGYVTSPNGELMYVNITGQGKENYDGDDYDYVSSVDVPLKEGGQDLIDEINAFLEEYRPSSKHELRKNTEGGDALPYRTHKMSESVPKGKVRFNFKTKTTYDSGDQKKIKIFNYKNEQRSLPEGVKIGNGSIGCISGKISGYQGKKDYGCSLWLNGIQILKLEEYNEQSGFEAQEDGEFDNFDQHFEGAVEEKKDAGKKKKKKKKDQ